MGVQVRGSRTEVDTYSAVPMLIDYYIEELVNFLQSPLPKSLLSVRPNQAALAGFKVPYEWERWWDDPTPWQTILEYYQVRCCSGSSLTISNTLYF
jgi:hypothetical protein